VSSGTVKALVYFETSLLTMSITSGTLTKTFVGFFDEFIDVLSVHVGLEFFERNSFIFAFKTNKHRFSHLAERPEAFS
jgi:hypothetical protein